MTWEVLESISWNATWWDWVLTFINFIVNCVVFLWNAIITLLSSIGRFAKDVLNWTLFWYINDIFQTLSIYLWTSWATILMWLFWLTFLMIVFGFVFRLLKWQVNYTSAMHRKEYFDKYDALKK